MVGKTLRVDRLVSVKKLETNTKFAPQIRPPDWRPSYSRCVLALMTEANSE
jgi:hypothetical protein